MEACLRKITLEKSFYRFPLPPVMLYIAFDVVKSTPPDTFTAETDQMLE